MKPYLIKYFDMCKIILCLLMTIGCNLSIDGHFWPDNILPYVFLVLNSYALFHIDWQKLRAWFMQNKTRICAGIIIIFCILLQAVILRIYLVDSVVVFIKGVIKVLSSGISTGIILIFCLFKANEEKKIPGIPFIFICLIKMVYFYVIRRITDNFSIYPLLLLMLVYLSMDNVCSVKSNTNKERVIGKESIITIIGAALLAIFETLGYLALTYWEYSGGTFKWLGLAVVGIVVWTFIFYYVLNALFAMFDNISLPSLQLLSASSKSSIEGNQKSYTKEIVLISVIAIALRFLYWLNWFPALLSKDTYLQIEQALGNAPYSNHNPWLHTILIKLFMSIGISLFGSNQAGVAVTAFVSFIISSLLLIFILKYYYNKLPFGVWVLAVIIFILDPIQCVYSVSIWKDTLFAYALLAFCFLLMVMERQLKQQGELKPYMWLLYVVVSFIFCFSRTNGLYAWFFTLPFLLWHYRKKIKPWIITTIVCLVLIIGYKGWMFPHFQVTEPDTVEALSVPLQQIAFTIQNDGKFSQYDTGVINSFVDIEAMGKQYNAHISDPVKNLIRNSGYQEYITRNKLDFIKMYISVGVKNPTDYMVAFLNQSRGYWYQKMSNYIYYREGVHSFAQGLGIYRNSPLPAGVTALADRLMDKYCDVWHALWSLALNTHVVWLLFVYLLIKKMTCYYFLPVIGVFITLVIATPVNDEFRYAYGIYLVLPLLIMNVFSKEEAA